jgi:hypothetical protein
MVQNCHDLWIILKNGVVIYNQSEDNQLDPLLFGGFMAAFSSFASELKFTDISKIELVNNSFYITQTESLLYIANFDKKIKPKKAMEELQKIKLLFSKMYPEELIAKWCGDISFFANFTEILQGSHLISPIHA